MNHEYSIEILGQKFSYPTNWYGFGSVVAVCTAIVLIAYTLDADRLRGWTTLAKEYDTQSSDYIAKLENSVNDANVLISNKNKEIARLREIVDKSYSYSKQNLTSSTIDSSNTPVSAVTKSWFQTKEYGSEIYPKTVKVTSASEEATQQYQKSLSAIEESRERFMRVFQALDKPMIGAFPSNGINTKIYPIPAPPTDDKDSGEGWTPPPIPPQEEAPEENGRPTEGYNPEK